MTIHFTRKESSCECGCGFDVMDYDLVLMLEDGRTHFSSIYGRVKVVSTGWNRCVSHNEEIQKKYVKNYIPFSSRSQHLLGKAIDHKYFYMKNGEWIQIPSDEVYNYYNKKYPNGCGLGKYHNRTHLDSRINKVRWIG